MLSCTEISIHAIFKVDDPKILIISEVVSGVLGEDIGILLPSRYKIIEIKNRRGAEDTEEKD
ncbi:MAG: hypothetical protein SAK29_21705 [Scytonema sp. PMC 1069.18]|nr:hypothetical protein [Scytonema sp. PMC 1069.18]MEC4881658.1 hypothetical protein [Scytonema sp. PMC 1070.18]